MTVVNVIPGFLYSVPQDAKIMPPYNERTYRELSGVATKLASQFGLTIIAGYKEGAGETLQGRGLAFDLAGETSKMKRLARWAIERPRVFQEVFILDEGEGMHLHLGFYPDAAKTLSEKSRRYEAARNNPR